MKTEKLYLLDRYLKKAEAQVLEVSPSPAAGEIIAVLDRTIFFPGGGGQSCDLGTIAGQSVTKVEERDNVVLHHVKSADGGAAITPDATVEMEIDWARRFDNMQRHCGEHILSGVFFDLFGGVNRGFHMGDDYMTIDISLEEDKKVDEITFEMALEAELAANRIIWQDLPVIAHHFDTKAEAESIATRKELAIEEDITIVTIGDDSHPADSVACCGTHPSTSGQVGMLKIYKVEPNKGMFRVFFEAGERALMGYRSRFDTLSYLEKDLSAGNNDLIAKYETRKEKNSEVRDRLYKLTQTVLNREKEAIVNQPDKNVYEYEILTVDDLINLGRSLQGNTEKLLILVHNPSLTLLLFSDTVDCGKLVKENAAVFGGKGGGNNSFARAIFSRKDDANMFIDALDKLQR